MVKSGLTRRQLPTLLIVAGLVAPNNRAAADDGNDIVATIAQIGNTAARIGGRRVRVITLLGEGVDPHTYRQTRADMNRLAVADIILWNGLHLEAQLEQPLREFARRKPVIAAGDFVPPERLIAHPEYPGRFDPHIWMDPRLWAHVAQGIRDYLIRIDRYGADLFLRNTEDFLADLDRIHDYATRAVASIPASARTLVTAHDAFNYFGRAYGLEVHGIQGLSTESEAGVRQISDLVDLLVTRRIPAVFVESSVSDRNIRALVEGAAAQGHRVAIGGELFSDSLGAPGTYEGTLIGMLDHNVTTIVRALGGTVPARGMAGRLTERG